jgi:hypothetical protein
MIISEDKWNEIIKATEAKVDKWNASAKKSGVSDTFNIETEVTDRYCFIHTRHKTGGSSEHKVAARELATGQVWPAKIQRKKGRGIGVMVTKRDPKAWATLADKPADVIVGKLGLSNFIMVIGAHITGVHAA